MRVLSIKINKKEIYYAVIVKQNDGNIILEIDNKIDIPQNKSLPNLMSHQKDTFDNLLEQYHPNIDKVIYWCDKNESPNIAMQLGILNYCCLNKNLHTISKYNANITAKRLGFITNERGNAAIKLIKNYFPNSKYKNDEIRKVFAIAMLVLKERN